MNDAPAPCHRKLLASGHYDYFLDGVLQTICEDWKLYEDNDGLWLESERRVPAVELSLTVSTEIREGQIARSYIRWCQGGRRVASALFKRGTDGHDYLHRVAGAGSRRHSCRGAVFFPLLRVFTGTVFSGVRASIDQSSNNQTGIDGSAARDVELFIPWIKDPAQTSQLLSPSVSQRQVRSCGAPLPSPTVARVPSSPMPTLQELECYEYVGDQYGEGTRFWLSKGLLQAYTWQQPGQSTGGNWYVALAGMAGTWPGELFRR
ncbi:hypothetical protein [Microbulbifer sp. ALW1]|uniref:hypothetical protein n=1 Tax=Microbulbifer sp. (strain ALW1) TaxID=1516059 RepID=UPI00135A04CE|nr:hypothetical protein [Microbulbifer sp. ALW1]